MVSCGQVEVRLRGPSFSTCAQSASLVLESGDPRAAHASLTEMQGLDDFHNQGASNPHVAWLIPVPNRPSYLRFPRQNFPKFTVFFPKCYVILPTGFIIGL